MHKHPKNVPGKYYVVYEWCLAHGVCEHCAPANFRMDDEWGSSYVYKQPDTHQEEKLCKQAMADCPVAAIKDDGEMNLSITAYSDPIIKFKVEE